MVGTLVFFGGFAALFAFAYWYIEVYTTRKHMRESVREANAHMDLMHPGWRHWPNVNPPPTHSRPPAPPAPPPLSTPDLDVRVKAYLEQHPQGRLLQHVRVAYLLGFVKAGNDPIARRKVEETLKAMGWTRVRSAEPGRPWLYERPRSCGAADAQGDWAEFSLWWNDQVARVGTVSADARDWAWRGYRAARSGTEQQGSDQAGGADA